MTSQSAWTPRPTPPPAQGDWLARPRYAASDFPTLLWRERRLMAVVFVVILAVGVIIAFSLKTLYSAHSSVLVSLGQEYVYEPRAGDAARGAVPETGQVLQSEVEILASDALKERVIRKIGYGTLHPKDAKAFAAADPARQQKKLGAAVLAMDRGLKIMPAPDSPVIRLAFDDPDPRLAALVLNTLLDEYLIYRRSVLLDPATGPLEQQRRAFEERLIQADKAYQQFLSHNQIGDFDAEKTSLSALQAQIEQQRYAAQAQLKERTARLAGLSGELGRLSPEVGLFHDIDNTAANKLLDLKLQRESLLSRYRPEAQPVKDLDAQIAQLQSAVSSGRAQGQGAQRTGVNPVYQTLQTEKLQLSAEVEALTQTLATLTQQTSELTQRRLRLAELEPEYQNLSRDRDVLSSNVKDFTVKEQQSQASQELAKGANDNIRIVQRASTPTQGKSLKRPVLILTVLFAGFTALCVGLARMFLRPGLPTPASAARTLDLPILGTAALKA